MKTKSTKRIYLNRKRAHLTTNQITQMSQLICEKIASSEVFIISDYIALYSSLFNEVNLSVLLTIKKHFSLPVVGADNSMAFHHYNKDTIMVKNKYGILEPQNQDIIENKNIDLCLMPLVGFNRKGRRLGMGGGYYDRYFQNNRELKKPTILAGIAYDFQEDDTIKTESWDVPLDMIFTNKEVIYCGEKF